MLQGNVVALKGERDALLGQLGDLRVGVARGGPALDVGRLGPPGQDRRGIVAPSWNAKVNGGRSGDCIRRCEPDRRTTS